MNCLESGKGYRACIISGRCISNERAIQCKTCHHYMIEKELVAAKWLNCPLCHTENAIDTTLVTIVEEEEDDNDDDMILYS
mmetsp:Transcript_18057/g.17412  ORF Transcript_18057/g.17412 Transcript_18057/m.17412 type:complete len:81 (-) Transcript_18057:154-396(-)